MGVVVVMVVMVVKVKVICAIIEDNTSECTKSIVKNNEEDNEEDNEKKKKRIGRRETRSEAFGRRRPYAESTKYGFWIDRVDCGWYWRNLFILFFL